MRFLLLHALYPTPGMLRLDSVLFTVIGQISLALRRHYDPAMFEPENLARILCPEKYEYVLDRWVFHSSWPVVDNNSLISLFLCFQELSPIWTWPSHTYPNSFFGPQSRVWIWKLWHPYCNKVSFDLLLEQAWTCLFCRHYGPMVFNLCWNKQQDELLVHLVVNDR